MRVLHIYSAELGKANKLTQVVAVRSKTGETAGPEAVTCYAGV